MSSNSSPARVAIIGGGPAGLMAAEVLGSAGLSVTVYDHMPSLGRKFLMAGRGGLNLTHSEPLPLFVERYNEASSWLAPVINNFPPEALCAWSHSLDQPTFVGTSGRIFPEGLKASPLLRAWLRRLDQLGVEFSLKQKWIGWDPKDFLVFKGPDQQQTFIKADATLLALGGASWPRLGSTGNWVDILTQHQISLSPLSPANCGFLVPWSDHFRQRCEGQPLKPVALSFGDESILGEVVITAQGLEGGPIYRQAHRLKQAIASEGAANLRIDLRPGLSVNELSTRLQSPRGSQSLSNYLRKWGGLSSVAINLLYEVIPASDLQKASPPTLAQLIKACPVRLAAAASIERAISTAGGIRREDLNEHFMLRQKPGVFAAGEMLDWEAPTGGYLLQATFSTAVAAAQGILNWINSRQNSHHDKV